MRPFHQRALVDEWSRRWSESENCMWGSVVGSERSVAVDFVRCVKQYGRNRDLSFVSFSNYYSTVKHNFYELLTRIFRMIAHVPNPAIMSPKFLLAFTIVSMTFVSRIHIYFSLNLSFNYPRNSGDNIAGFGTW